MPVEVALIDAMVADLEANGGLGEDVLIVKYRRPRIILPEDCPVLVVALDESGSVEAPKGTVRFTSLVPIALEWHEAAVEEVRTLVDDPDLSVSLITNAGLVRARARKWAIETGALGGVSLGVAGVDELGPAAMIPFVLEDGFVEGIRLIVQVTITEDA